MMRKKALYKNMHTEVFRRVGNLKETSYSDLSALPGYSGEDLAFDRWRYTIATWREIVDDGAVQIVIQAYHHAFLGMGTMVADGFRKTKDAEITDVPADIRFNYH